MHNHVRSCNMHMQYTCTGLVIGLSLLCMPTHTCWPDRYINRCQTWVRCACSNPPQTASGQECSVCCFAFRRCNKANFIALSVCPSFNRLLLIYHTIHLQQCFSKWILGTLWAPLDGLRIDPERSVSCDSIQMEPNGPCRVHLVPFVCCHS